MEENGIEYSECAKMVQFALCLTGTNAPVERVFLMNNVWDAGKTQLKSNTVKDILSVKVNIDLNCMQFYDKVKNLKELLESVHSSKKYKWNKKQ